MLPITENWDVISKDIYSVDGVQQNFNHIAEEVTRIKGLYFEVESNNNSSGYAHGFTRTGVFYCSIKYIDFMLVGARLRRNGQYLRIVNNPVRSSKFGISYLEILVEDITEALVENQSDV